MFPLAFGNSLFLWMLPGAAIPVLFHLFYRIRRRPRLFPSLLFFIRADPRISMRRRLREWLALILRCLLILLTLLALSRPVWMGHGGGGVQTVIVVIDNSGSMSAAASDGRTCLDEALDGAAALLSDLGPADRAGLVLLVNDPTVGAPSGVTADHAALRAGLARVRQTQASGNPGQAIERAFAAMASSSSPGAIVHIFTDIQAGEWERNLTSPLHPPQGASVLVHRINPARLPQANVSISRLEAPRLRVLAGRTALAEVELLNHGRGDCRVRVNTGMDNSEPVAVEATVPAGDAKTLRLPLHPREPGIRWMRLWIEDSGLSADNEAYLAYEAGSTEAVTILGRREDHGPLPLILAPGGGPEMSGLAVAFAPPADTATALATRKPALAVSTWDAIGASPRPAAEALQRYVSAGGRLLLLAQAGSTQNADASPPARFGVQAGAAQRSETGRRALVLSRSDPIWTDLRDENGEVQLGHVLVFRWQALSLPTNAVPLLGLDDGTVLLARVSAGSGTVFAAGISLSPAASTLPLKAASLALFQGMALIRADADSAISRIVAGSPVPLTALPPQGTIDLSTVAGPALAWRGARSNLPDLPWAGVYRVKGTNTDQLVSVTSSAAEGDLRYVTASAVPILAGARHEVIAYRGPEALVREVRRRRTGTDLMLPFLVFAFLAFAAEAWVVNPPPLRGPAPAPGRGWIDHPLLKRFRRNPPGPT